MFTYVLLLNTSSLSLKIVALAQPSDHEAAVASSWHRDPAILRQQYAGLHYITALRDEQAFHLRSLSPQNLKALLKRKLPSVGSLLT